MYYLTPKAPHTFEEVMGKRYAVTKERLCLFNVSTYQELCKRVTIAASAKNAGAILADSLREAEAFATAYSGSITDLKTMKHHATIAIGQKLGDWTIDNRGNSTGGSTTHFKGDCRGMSVTYSIGGGYETLSVDRYGETPEVVTLLKGSRTKRKKK